MITLIAPGTPLEGTLHLPSSKSISNRALLLSLLGGGTQPVENTALCDDTRVLVKALSSVSSTVDVGAAGTAMRFLTAYYALQEGRSVTLTGSERMKQRPIGVLVNALRSLGARIDYAGQEGFPPLFITGSRLRGGSLTVDAAISSQYISALLMIAPLLEGGLTLHLEGDIVSLPYIEMTLEMMRLFGARACREKNLIVVEQGSYRSLPFTVESDWSAASYGYALVALTPSSRLFLPGLHQVSLQGDSAAASLFSSLGVATHFDEKGVTLTHTAAQCSRFSYDFVEQPDLVQTFAVVCCLKNIPFSFTGVHNLALKETDRLQALVTELAKLGYTLLADTDSLSWEGSHCTPQEQPVIATYQDHRMAMAFAPATLLCGPLHIQDETVVSKSFPDFWDQLARLGFVIQ